MTKIYGYFERSGSNAAAAPFSYNRFGASGYDVTLAQVLSSDLKDDTNTSTGVSLEVINPFGASTGSNSGATVDAGEFTSEALEGYWYIVSGVATIRFEIPANSSYTLQLAAHQDTQASRDTNFTVDSQTKLYDCSGDPASITAPVEFTGTTTTGVIDVDIQTSTTSRGAINGFILEYTAASSTETATTGNIPLVIQAGGTKVDLVNPVTTNASLLFGYTGDAPVTGDDLEYDVTSSLNSGVTFGVTADGVWTITEASAGNWTTAITVDRRVVQADGTIGTEATMTFDPSTGSGSITPPNPFSFSRLIKALIDDGSYTGSGNTVIMNWLEASGQARGQLNQMLYKYLGTIGYTRKTLNERLKDWSEG